MAKLLKPATIEDLSGLIAEAAVTGESIALEGLGTKSGLGRAIAAQHRLSLAAFSGIIAYEPEELILEAGSATPLAEIKKLLKAQNQHLAFEPPDLSKLLGAAHQGSLGGLLACNLSGPRRLTAGGARDHVLGVAAVSGRGEAFKAGARVVKNVTGYDLPKLMANSHGTLAAMTSIIMKVLPAPEAEQTMVLSGLDPAEAVAVMSQAMQSSCEVSGAAYMGGLTLLRLEGIPASIAYRRDKLHALLKDYKTEMNPDAKLWQQVRDVAPLANQLERNLWRISTTPSEAPQFLAGVMAKADVRHVIDWAGGLIWLDLPPSFDCGATLVRGCLASGHATLMRATQERRRHIPVFQPQSESLAALSRRVKASFDPASILNPGRMFEGC